MKRKSDTVPVDTQRYLKRINYHGSVEANVTTLHALTRAHTQAIPFENIDVLLGHGVSLQSDDIFQKLVEQGRGGYCFEQNLLFARMLASLGFDIRSCGGRVRLKEPDRNVYPARTHLFLLVQLNQQLWLTDVGFGAQSLTQAVPLVSDQVCQTPHGPRRLQRVGKRWFHQIRNGQDWVDAYEFTLAPMHPKDQLMANWYTSTHPDSHFTSALTIARACPDGGRVTVHNTRFNRLAPDGTVSSQTLNKAMLHNVLVREFNLHIGESEALWHKLQVLCSHGAM